MNKGFSSIYVILCLSSLILFLLCVTELCAGYAAGSICENVCLISGESVLSEYQKDLQRRYGVFALSSYEQKLERLSSFYIRENLNGAGILVRPRLRSCSVSAEGTGGLDTNILASQIDALGLMTLGRDVLDETGALRLLKELLDPLNKPRDKEALSELGNIPPSSAGKGKSPAKLLEEYREAMEPDLGEREGRSLVSVHKDRLPTALLGVSPSSSLLKYSVTALLQDGLSAGALLQSCYTVHVCSDLLQVREDTVLGLETEYVLFGRSSDKENEAEMKKALFKIRTAVNLIGNLSNEAKMNGYAAAAASFPAIPPPIAVTLLAAIDAARQAKGEVEVLCGGGCVEILPGMSEGRKIGTYRDYAALLLMLLPQQTRLARLMDIMQINVAYMDGASFAFQDYCYGYTLQAVFEKNSFVPLLSGQLRQGRVEQIHRYH